jgi:hypothetical protein
MKFAGFAAGLRTSLVAAGLSLVAVGAMSAPAAAQSFQDLAQIMHDIQSSADSAILGITTRPESPFVAGVAAQTKPGECAPGVWARGTAGNAKTGGHTFNVDVNYAGAQVAADMACFDVNSNGLDYTIGGSAGVNGGNATVNTVTGKVDFTQFYASVYGTFVAGPWLGDLQVRADRAKFSTSGLSVGMIPAVPSSDVTMDRLGINGTLRYAFDLSNGVQLVPVVGFDLGRSQLSTISTVFGAIDFDPSYSDLLYAGATLSKTIPLPDGKSAIVPSINANYYFDLSPSVNGVLHSGGGDTTFTVAGGQGFAEIGGAIAYAKLLDTGAKQLTASVRGNYRWNANYSSAAVTGQLRIQF